MTVCVLNARLRPMLEARLPGWLDVRWFSTKEELYALAPEAEIGWFDNYDLAATHEAARRITRLKWLNTLAAGVDPFPLALLREKGVVLTNGAGLNAITIAEYAVMGMLTIAKGWREVVRAQERREWLSDAPGKAELHGSKALIVGAGGIGSRTGELLRAFGVEVTEVRRTPAPGVLGPSEWRARLGLFDWVIVAVPSTPETDQMIGAAELAAMKPSAAILNFARGAVIDQPALVAALREKTIAAAFLDVTDPEPLPPDNPLWGLDNCHISMHLSGRSQTQLFARNAERFLENLGGMSGASRWSRWSIWSWGISHPPAAAARFPPPAAPPERRMLHRHHCRIGDDLAGEGEFVLRQGGDERLATCRRFAAKESQRDGVAAAGKGCAGPGAFAVAQQFGLAAGEFENG